VVAAPGQLFEADLPAGFHYRDEFISRQDEAALLDDISRIVFSNFEMRGVVARVSPAAPIGWHRDAPQYDVVVGLPCSRPHSAGQYAALFDYVPDSTIVTTM
jgi:hypothetical protein